jgi:hypothetical protein
MSHTQSVIVIQVSPAIRRVAVEERDMQVWTSAVVRALFRSWELSSEPRWPLAGRPTPGHAPPSFCSSFANLAPVQQYFSLLAFSCKPYWRSIESEITPRQSMGEYPRGAFWLIAW